MRKESDKKRVIKDAHTTYDWYANHQLMVRKLYPSKRVRLRDHQGFAQLNQNCRWKKKFDIGIRKPHVRVGTNFEHFGFEDENIQLQNDDEEVKYH